MFQITISKIKFQSPTNRVQCSDSAATPKTKAGVLSFNPLQIGSSVLMKLSIMVMPVPLDWVSIPYKSGPVF